MGAADRDGHPADPHRQRIAAERAAMERLDRDALVEAEVAQAAAHRRRRARAQSIAAIRARRPSFEVVEGGRSRHIATDYQ